MYLLTALLLIGAAIIAPSSLGAGEEGIVLPSLPPSLGRWYKPANKRQVWLHTMFALRREMQAVSEYLDSGDWGHARAWAERLAGHYERIGEMVPEWREQLDPDELVALRAALKRRDTARARRALRALSHGCDACHRDYRALAAARYRVPTYRDRRVTVHGETLTYPALMARLSVRLNRIKIAAMDGRKADARGAFMELRTLLDALGGDCAACHRQDPVPRERILGDGARALLDRLEQALSGAETDSGRLLGEMAVTVCARCHGLHRTLADLRERVFREEMKRQADR